MKLVRFFNDGDENLESEFLHYTSFHTDHTLCGDTLDGDSKTAGRFEMIEAAKVTCPACIDIIRHCRKAKI